MLLVPRIFDESWIFVGPVFPALPLKWSHENRSCPGVVRCGDTRSGLGGPCRQYAGTQRLAHGHRKCQRGPPAERSRAGSCHYRSAEGYATRDRHAENGHSGEIQPRKAGLRENRCSGISRSQTQSGEVRSGHRARACGRFRGCIIIIRPRRRVDRRNGDRSTRSRTRCGGPGSARGRQGRPAEGSGARRWQRRPRRRRLTTSLSRLSSRLSCACTSWARRFRLPPAPTNHFPHHGGAIRDEESREGNLGQLLDLPCTYPRRRIPTVEP